MKDSKIISCSICNSSGEIGNCVNDVFKIDNCPKCGKYNLSTDAFNHFDSTSLTIREVVNISSYIANNQGLLISETNLNFISNLKCPSVLERSENLLLYLGKKSNHIGYYVKQTDFWGSISWSENKIELREIIAYLRSINYIEPTGTTAAGYKLTFDGWTYLDNLQKVNSESNQAFVAMWFDKAMNKIYENAICPAIEKACYKPHRVDQREHNDKIDDEIIAQIRRSKFVIADFTGHRGGVYYEAGFAKGLGLEVIWLCRDDHLEDLHFDVRQYNCIVWSENDLDKLRSDLQFRIESVFGRGSNPS